MGVSGTGVFILYVNLPSNFLCVEIFFLFCLRNTVTFQRNISTYIVYINVSDVEMYISDKISTCLPFVFDDSKVEKFKLS